MIFLKFLSAFFGLAFTLFGYFIFFKKKYTLINGFKEDFKAGRKTETYAKRVGILEFALGVAILIVSFFLILFI